ncbi:transcriptional regulator TrmB, partial [mine drainage metagenome]
MVRPASGLAQMLADHGVADKPARVYLAACRAGPQTASELARLSAVNRVEAYRFIKQLTDDGLLLATGSRPGRFAALPPERLIDRWIRRASERVQRLESDRDKVLAEWREGRTEFDDGDPRRFAVLEGR